MTDQTNGAMPPETQITCAVEEVMGNIFTAIFGENRDPNITYNLSGITISGLGEAHAVASAMTQSGRKLLIKADVPIRYPDAECRSFRVDDSVFAVELNSATALGSKFQAWHGHNLYEGAKVIVRQVYRNGRERWRIADSLEREVLFRGPYDDLPWWAKKIVAKKWSHLPHVCLDTEARAAASISYEPLCDI